MRRRQFLANALGGIAVAAGVNQAHASSSPRRPNVVVVVADDLGYADLGVQGCTDIPTPHIDSIAHNGVRFTDAYVVSPVCSPSRAGLITGRYPQRFGHEFNPGPIDQAQFQFGLPLAEKTLADRLQSAGYATAAIGKWHLGTKPAYHPLRRGFTDFYGFLGGMHPYLDLANREIMLRGTAEEPCLEYTTDAFAKETVGFIRRNGDNPFFAYVAFNAVHEPLEIPQQYRVPFKHIENERRRTFAGMVSALDRAVGSILEAVRDRGQWENTLVFFLSDNGGPTRQTTTRNDPLRGYKGQVYEGGIRVPLLMQWPEKVTAKQTVSTPVSALDIVPTALAAAQIDASDTAQLDGANLAQIVASGDEKQERNALFWRYGRQRAIRSGSWKLVQGPESRSWELYNLATDIEERQDCAAEQTAHRARLESMWNDWNATLAAPRWKESAPFHEPED